MAHALADSRSILMLRSIHAGPNEVPLHKAPSSIGGHPARVGTILSQKAFCERMQIGLSTQRKQAWPSNPDLIIAMDASKWCKNDEKLLAIAKRETTREATSGKPR